MKWHFAGPAPPQGVCDGPTAAPQVARSSSDSFSRRAGARAIEAIGQAREGTKEARSELELDPVVYKNTRGPRAAERTEETFLAPEDNTTVSQLAGGARREAAEPGLAAGGGCAVHGA